MLLTDVTILDNITILEESKSGGTMRVRGVFQRADEPNNNGRLYEKRILEREIVRLCDSLSERRLMGELDHPTYDSVKLQNVSHLITNLKMVGNDMIGEAELLNTPAGLTAQALVKSGVKLGISSRGLGTLTESDGVKKVNNDYKLITFDLVADPSTKGAYPSHVNENSILVEETIRSTMGKVTAERVFITLLKNKLNK